METIRRRSPHRAGRPQQNDAQLCENPIHPSHRFEALRGEVSDYNFRRLDSFHRVVYRIERPEVVVVSCLGHEGVL